jgi:hypothetical protein
MLFTLDLRYQLYIWAMNSQQIISQVNTDAGDPWRTKQRFRSKCILINEDRGHLVVCGQRLYLWKISEEVKPDVNRAHLHNPIAIL